MARSRPYVILNAAMSIDGKIATHKGNIGLSSQRDLLRVHKLRNSVDAIIVGKKTIEIDNPLLSVRLIKGRNPIRIVLDSKGSTSVNSKLIKTAKKIPTILVVSEKAPMKTKNLSYFGVEVIRCGKNKINLKRLMKILWEKGIRKVLVEGGGTTNWYFFYEKLVDEFSITVTPCILGGTNAISFVEGCGFDKIVRHHSFKLKKITRLKNELVLHYSNV